MNADKIIKDHLDKIKAEDYKPLGVSRYEFNNLDVMEQDLENFSLDLKNTLVEFLQAGQTIAYYHQPWKWNKDNPRKVDPADKHADKYDDRYDIALGSVVVRTITYTNLKTFRINMQGNVTEISIGLDPIYYKNLNMTAQQALAFMDGTKSLSLDDHSILANL